MLNKFDPGLLTRLVACHSTPGDEGEVAALLQKWWCKEGWLVERLGDFAIIAHQPPTSANNRLPLLLVAAHMDSPGFIVDRFIAPPDKRHTPAWSLLPLGGPTLTSRRTCGILKTTTGKLNVTIHRDDNTDEAAEPHIRCTLTEKRPAAAAEVVPGDRVAFAATPAIDGNTIKSPFLDNRLGCWLTAEVTRHADRWPAKYRLAVAATSAEEFTGHGAAVLAHHLRPDLTLVVDATYANQPQGVVPGGGRC